MFKYFFATKIAYIYEKCFYSAFPPSTACTLYTWRMSNYCMKCKVYVAYTPSITTKVYKCFFFVNNCYASS